MGAVVVKWICKPTCPGCLRGEERRALDAVFITFQEEGGAQQSPFPVSEQHLLSRESVVRKASRDTWVLIPSLLFLSFGKYMSGIGVET